MKDHDEKKLIDYILIILLFIDIIIYLIFIQIDDFSYVNFVCIIVLFLILFIIFPIMHSYRKGIISGKSIIISLLARTLLLTAFAFSLYQISLTRNYELKYTYWVCIISFILLILSFTIEVAVNEYKNRLMIGKKHNKLYFLVSSFLLLFLNGMPIYPVVDFLTRPQSQITINNLHPPESIDITDNSSDDIMDTIHTKIRITDSKDIQMIIDELNTIKADNLNFTEVLNYERMKEDNGMYYLIWIDNFYVYNQSNQTKQDYRAFIVITPNRKVVIKKAIDHFNFFLLRSINDTYPINFTDETMDMIFRYIY